MTRNSHMGEEANLGTKIRKRLPAGLVELLQKAGELACRLGWNLYLVGGLVRDLLLEQDNLDVDLVVEGDALELAARLAGELQAELTIHRRFGTAKLEGNGWALDLATARSETYSRPGALPEVRPGFSIREDLLRRDFTINAMAVLLSAERFGELIDPFGGRKDLKAGLVRVLHDRSFIDDPTRIWRAIRYEQRLDFRLEARTLRLLKRDIAMLDTVSGDRIRRELELVLRERFPEKALRRSHELGILQKVNPSLKGDEWLAGKFAGARQQSAVASLTGLYLALLCYRMDAGEAERSISYLRLPRRLERTVMDAVRLKDQLHSLAHSLAPGDIYHILRDFLPVAITANQLATDSPSARANMELYLGKLRYARTSLNGNDLMKMGIPEGPAIKKVLHRLLDARLNGEAITREDEMKLVNRWLPERPLDRPPA